MKRRFPESDLHKAVAKYLDLVLMPDTWWTSIAHGNRGKPVRGALWKAAGAKKGVPDILIIHGNSACFIELKAPGIGRLSPEQVACHEALVLAGARVTVARSIDDVQDALARWRIPTRHKCRTEKGFTEPMREVEVA